MNNNKIFGNAGEDAVIAYLRERCFDIVARNYTVRPYGEIDIIAQQKDLIVFVEVKARQKEYFDTTEVITRSKQRKIATVAQIYMLRHKLEDKCGRFDVALVTPSPTQGFAVSYLENAFDGEG